MRRGLAAGAAALALLAACGGEEHRVHSGRVIGRHHDAAYTTYRMQCVSYSSAGACQVNVPFPDQHPERWWIVISACEVEEAGCRHEDFDVDRDSWDRAVEGTWWNDGTGKANS